MRSGRVWPHWFRSRPVRSVAELLKPILRWAYHRPRLFPVTVDLAAWIVGLVIGAVLKLVFSVGATGLELVLTGLVAIAIHGLLGWAVGLYRQRWRVSSFDEVSALSVVWGITSILLIVGTYGVRQLGTDLPTSAVIMGSFTTLLLLGVTRSVWRRWWEFNRRPDLAICKRTVVFGAGEGGAQIVRAMLLEPTSAYYPVALLDDDPHKRNRELDGVRVMGTRADLATVARAKDAEVLLIALPSATASLIKELAEKAAATGLEVRVLPAASELVGKMTLADVRPPTVDDLLGRDPVEIDLEAVSDYVRGKCVLITGAGGSIGSELSQQVRAFGPSNLFLLDRDESALHALQLSMEGRALLDTDMLVVADIRDRERMFELFDRFSPEVVFHTAALKHLTLLENHPTEGMKTNTVGTKNLLDAAEHVGVGRFVNISTDKAADPTSVLGATKLAAERLTAAMAAKTGLPYVSVRFGNVLGSRGSVLPTFMTQIEQGQPITVTHPDVTRYFMTIPEAVRLVVQAGAIGRPGEVLILDMGVPVKIVDLAEHLINMLRPGAKIEFTGLRPGEKLHEALIGVDETGEVTSHPRITHTAGDTRDPSEALAAVDEAAVLEVRELLHRCSAANRANLAPVVTPDPYTVSA